VWSRSAARRGELPGLAGRHDQRAVDVDRADDLLVPVGPHDPHAIGSSRPAEAEVDLERILRDLVRAGAHIAHLLAATRAHKDFGADREGVRRLSEDTHVEVVPPGAAAVVPP